MIQKIQKCLVFSMLIVLIIPCTGQACTTFLLEHDGRQFFGKNYDWHLGSGLAIINQRGITKTALKGRRKDPVAYPSWTSKYGSLTFNQYGRELPSGGINEAGLTIEVMMLYETQYSKPDARNPITELQWIQFQLDNCSSVNQVIETNSKIRILHKETPVHFLVADKSGNCVSIEWIDGKMVYHTKDSMPVKVLANNTYKDSIRYLNRHKGFGGTLSIHHTGISLDRFVIAASMLKQYQSQPEKPMADYAFDILKNVSQVSTQW
ncbi:MAG: linear amide C-N hydrolase, partial [Proteobacteria bacterium]|nr:linear amide C-N hydrolase [Pseudomonadota bacterium]